MSLSSLIGNEQNKELLKRSLRSGRLPHALLFAGPEGVGKRQFALSLAKAVNCQQAVSGAGAGVYPEDSCDRCGSCFRIANKEHLDVVEIKPDGAYIRIDQAREVARQAMLRPMEGRKRVFCIDEAEKLRDEAANAILKTLEEPPETTLIILITATPNSLLPTLRSRCQLLNFAPLPIEEIESYLAANYKRPAADTRLLARLSNGSIGRAISIDLSVYRNARKELLELTDVLARSRDPLRLIKAAEHFGKKEREEFIDILDIWSRILRDIFSILLDQKEGIVNEDVITRLEQLAAAVSIRLISELAESIEELRRNLRVNINKQIALESLFLRIIDLQATS